MLEVEALFSWSGNVPPALHGLILEDGGEDDGDPPDHDKGDHAVAHEAEPAIDAENTEIEAQYGALDQGDIGGIVELA